MKRFMRTFVDCEVSMEHIRQRICNKLSISPDHAFNALDEANKGYLVLDDFKNFTKSMNMYPTDKNPRLVYERFDKTESGEISYDEFD